MVPSPASLGTACSFGWEWVFRRACDKLCGVCVIFLSKHLEKRARFCGTAQLGRSRGRAARSGRCVVGESSAGSSESSVKVLGCAGEQPSGVLNAGLKTRAVPCPLLDVLRRLLWCQQLPSKRGGDVPKLSLAEAWGVHRSLARPRVRSWELHGGIPGVEGVSPGVTWGWQQSPGASKGPLSPWRPSRWRIGRGCAQRSCVRVWVWIRPPRHRRFLPAGGDRPRGQVEEGVACVALPVPAGRRLPVHPPGLRQQPQRQGELHLRGAPGLR